MELFERYPSSYYHSLRTRDWRAPVLGGAILAAIRPMSIVDVGCGVGELIWYFRQAGIAAYGLEAPTLDESALLIPKECVTVVDLRFPINLRLEFDLAICFNVGEHIEEAHEGTFIRNLQSLAPRILFAASNSFKVLDHPRVVNIKSLERWEELLCESGMVRRKEIEQRLVNLVGSWKEKTVVKMVVDNLLYLERYELPENPNWGYYLS